LGIASVTAMAQTVPKPPYDELPVDPNQQQNRGTVEGRIMPRGTFAAGEKEVFDAYFKRYILPRWSVVKTVTSLPHFRAELRRHFQRCSMSGRPKEIHDYLGDMVLTWMDGFARSRNRNFHPAVRVNAMLMIGELNAEEKGSRSEPLPKALPVMLAALNEADYIDGVKVAAMIGIARHAEAGIADPAMQKQVGSVMFALLKSLSAAGRSPEGHAWMRAQAADVLANLGSAAGSEAVVTEMSKMVADSQLPFATRCAVAKSMGKLNLAGMDALPLATALGQMAVEACRQERPQDETANPEGHVVSRRRLMARLHAAVTALEAVAGAATDAEKDFVADLKTITEDLMAILDDTTINDLALLNLVWESEDELKTLLGQDTEPADLSASITGL